jgi:hypothetical protein
MSRQRMTQQQQDWTEIKECSAAAKRKMDLMRDHGIDEVGLVEAKYKLAELEYLIETIKLLIKDGLYEE